jgi:hypothetical protein
MIRTLSQLVIDYRSWHIDHPSTHFTGFFGLENNSSFIISAYPKVNKKGPGIG